MRQPGAVHHRSDRCGGIPGDRADAICSFNPEARDEPSWEHAPGEAANDAHYGDRAWNVRDVLDALAADADLGPRADLSHVVLAGHSLGGYTVLSMAAAPPTQKLSAVKAIVAFAPYTMPFAARAVLHDLDAPVMYQVGSLDPLFTFAVSGFGGAYARSPAPVLRRNRRRRPLRLDRRCRPRNHAIVDYAIAFVDCYVKVRPESPLLQARRPGVTS